MRKIKIDKESIRLIVVLAVIALISSLLLAVINMFTQVDEAQKLRDAIGEAYSSPLTDRVFDLSNYENLEKTEVSDMFEAEDGAIIILSKSTNCYNASKGVQLLVIIKEDKIIDIISYAHSETPGLGTNALTDSYLNQYCVYSVYDFGYVEGRLTDTTPVGKSVPAYTGATKTSNGVKDAVTAAARAYIKLVKEA
ncbi:MAG: FMN-binding protein [Clostridia bacterium]|nr:FMN-binding protein [Clostridia bacterium]